MALTIPAARLDVVILSWVAATTIENVADLLCTGLPLSVTDATKVKVPAALGVPEMTPVGTNVSPVGRLPDTMFQV